MRNRHSRGLIPAAFRLPLIVLFGLATASCGGDNSGGTEITTIPLPTDTLLNLQCEDVGIGPEKCVLNDPANPYATAIINEFDVNNPDADTKFDLANNIPAGRTGAKARFYLWATALARRASGENQWYTARALHELFNYNDDPLIQAQALEGLPFSAGQFLRLRDVFRVLCESGSQRRPGAFLDTTERIDRRRSVQDRCHRLGPTDSGRSAAGDLNHGGLGLQLSTRHAAKL